MKGSNTTFSEACAAWVDSFSRFFTGCYNERSRRDLPTPSFEVVHDQPTWALAPSHSHPYHKPAPREKRKRSLASRLRALTLRRTKAPRRNLRISSPTHFRHVYSHSHQFSADAFEYAAPQRRAPPPFAPLQVGGLSPVFPAFEHEHATPPAVFPAFGDEVATPPAVARLHDDNVFDLRGNRSALEFHVPRRPGTSSAFSTPAVGRVDSPPPPAVPPKSRARAYTAPENVDHLKERIAGAMLEKERLQGMIDDVIERQSIYLGSRPSTSHSMAAAPSRPDPLPAIPALPPAAPSFAERLNPDLRRPPQTPAAENASFPELVPRPLQVIPFTGPPTPPRSAGSEHAVQPPLPLVLRPPLRKKKSFSRVSSWLFPVHGRGLSVESVTNFPRPVRGEGFYQCVSPPVTDRRSGESVSSLGSGGSGGTVPTTLSAGSPRGERVSRFGRGREGVAV